MTVQSVYRTKKKIKLCEKNKIEISEIEAQAPFLLHAKLGAFLAKEKYQVDVAFQGVAEMDTPLMGDICITICSSFIIIAKDVL